LINFIHQAVDKYNETNIQERYFCGMTLTSTWCHWNAFSAIPLKFSRSAYLHIALMKLSNCCVERRQTLLCWNCDLTAAPDFNPVDYQMWAAMHERVRHTDIYDVDKLKLMQSWPGHATIEKLCKRREVMFVRKTVIFWSHHMNHHMNSLIITVYGLSHVTSLLKFSILFR